MASPTVMAAAAMAPQPPPALSDSVNSTAAVAATPRPVVPVTAVSKRTGLRPKPTPAPAAGAAPTPQAASVTTATASVDATAAGPPQLTIKLKQSVTKVADQSCHVPLDAALRPPIWVNAASDVRHFFVVNGQAPMFLDVADAADTGVWNRIAKYNVRCVPPSSAVLCDNSRPARHVLLWHVQGHQRVCSRCRGHCCVEHCCACWAQAAGTRRSQRRARALAQGLRSVWAPGAG